MKKIAIIGSINTDFVFRSQTLPKPSETIMGESFEVNFGGKGANEAVASARLGANTTLFGMVGNDLYSKENLKNLKREKVNISNVEVVKDVSGGSAGIIHGDGTNSIIVIGGANQKVDKKYLEKHNKSLLKNDIFCMQLETPFDTVKYAIDTLSQNNKTIIFNPSPIIPLDKELLDKCSYVIVNEVEIQHLPLYTNIEQTLQAYNGKLILTYGKDGAYFFNGKKVVHKPALKIKKVIDTTGAGDTFLASFAVALANDKTLEQAIEFANLCAGIKTTKKGTQTGMPKISEVNSFTRSKKH